MSVYVNGTATYGRHEARYQQQKQPRLLLIKLAYSLVVLIESACAFASVRLARGRHPAKSSVEPARSNEETT